MILDPTDQRIRDQGFNFVPFDRYLASPFQMPNIQTTDPNTGVMSVLPRRTFTSGEGSSGDYATSLGLGKDSRGFIGNFQDIDPNKMYSYTPQGITIEDLSKPSNIGDFQITTAPGLPDQSGYIKPAPEIFEPKKQNIFQRAISGLKDKGAQIAGGLMSFATGIPFLGTGLQAISNRFENRPLGAAVIDEFGNVYDEEELNRQNALGGYYSEAARSGRRRTSRINNMLERLALGKKISFKNLQELQAQEKAQEELQKAAARAIQDENRDRGRGGYQAGYSSDFMEGPSGRDSFSGDTDLSGSMGSFMDGGIVDLVDIYD
tara:strand:+ start:85 stop:1041 length:957 start_codon:yes stop_codon:yes gene_type:complete